MPDQPRHPPQTPLNPANAAFLERLRSLLPAAALRETSDAYLREPRGQWTGTAGAVAAPDSTEGVAAVVGAAAAARVPVVPYGGGTGLVGGQTMPEGPAPVLLSLERMNRVTAVHPRDGAVEAQAGATLEQVRAAAREQGMLFPLSLASGGSARIGGILATNAGGAGVLRHGNARDLCLGLEAVLPDGAIWNGMKRLRKDNMGYDLRGLLIGSEGTLGVITAASLRIAALPEIEETALAAVASPAAALDLLALCRRRLGDGVGAFELMHRTGLAFLKEVFPQMAMPFGDLPEWSVLVDVGLPAGAESGSRLEAVLAEAAEAGLVADGVVAGSEAQRRGLWDVREAIPEANRRIGAVCSHDVSVPLSAAAEFVAAADREVARFGAFRINCFGHVGDGNLHYNVFPPKGRARGEFADLAAEITRAVHDVVDGLGGSVGAEHGVGRLKAAELERYGDPALLAAMRHLKAALDPLGIMNPGAVLRPGAEAAPC